MSRAMIRIRTIRTRTTDQIIGYRLEAAEPNENGRVMKARRDGGSGEVLGFYATKESQPAFNRQYLIEQSSDFTYITKQEVEKFQARLRGRGYDKFQAVGRWDGAMRDLFDNDPVADYAKWIE